MSVFEKAVTEVKQGQEAFSNQTSTQTGNASPQERDITYFNRTLVIILHLICLLTKLLPHLDAKQTHQVKKAVFDFIKVGARGRGGATALHLACSRDSSAVGRYPICQFPSAEVISLLLECGADVEALDNEDNYPLHTAASNKPAKPNVVSTLLDSGAHLDAVNGEGRTFGELLRGQAVHEVVTVLKYSNLQCLAARAVRKQSIPHRGQIPAKLSDFVDLH
jgi:ankyrin repeat protein